MDSSIKEIDTFSPPSNWVTFSYHGDEEDMQENFQKKAYQLTLDLSLKLKEDSQMFNTNSPIDSERLFNKSYQWLCQERMNLAKESKTKRFEDFGCYRGSKDYVDEGREHTFLLDPRYFSCGNELIQNIFLPAMKEIVKVKKNAKHVVIKEDEFSRFCIRFLPTSELKGNIEHYDIAKRWFKVIHRYPQFDSMEANRFRTLKELEKSCIMENKDFKCFWVIGQLFYQTSPGVWTLSTEYLTWYPQVKEKANAGESLEEMSKTSRVCLVVSPLKSLPALNAFAAKFWLKSISWNPDLGKQELKNRIARVTHILANATFCKRGSASITEIMTKAIYKKENFVLEKYNNVLPDLFTYCHPLISDMVENYDSLFQKDPTGSQTLAK